MFARTHDRETGVSGYSASSRQPTPSTHLPATQTESQGGPKRAVRGTATTAQKKARAGDYNGDAKQLLEYAATLYKVNITSKLAYPDKFQERTWAKDMWAQASEDLGINLVHDADAIPLVCCL